MSIETGKPIAEARGEANAAADEFEWYSEETKRIYGQIIEPRTRDTRMAVIYQPVGVVAAFYGLEFPRCPAGAQDGRSAGGGLLDHRQTGRRGACLMRRAGAGLP